MASYVFTVLARAATLKWRHDCDAASLRAVSAMSLLLLACLVLLCLRQMEARARGAPLPLSSGPFSTHALHTASNIALFPLLFFFSGLYYTDVLSAAVVVGALLNHLRRLTRGHCSFLSGIWTVVLGLAALLMRQTNVFWVVVYMGGLEAVHAVKTLRPAPVAPPPMATPWAQMVHMASRYAAGDVHDAPLSAAWPDGEPPAGPCPPRAPAHARQTCSSLPSAWSSRSCAIRCGC